MNTVGYSATQAKILTFAAPEMLWSIFLLYSEVRSLPFRFWLLLKGGPLETDSASTNFLTMVFWNMISQICENFKPTAHSLTSKPFAKISVLSVMVWSATSAQLDWPRMASCKVNFTRAAFFVLKYLHQVMLLSDKKPICRY